MSAASFLSFTERCLVLSHRETRMVVRETFLSPESKKGCGERDSH